MGREPGTSNLSSGPLGTWNIWALGVGIVVCGQYFGWNLGLKGNGPAAMLLASLLVCLLFLAWSLTLAELAVAMPSADGPLAYGRRAGGPTLGFVMAWSMVLECLFGAVATALASGKYVAFLLNPASPDDTVAVVAGLATVGLIFLLQCWGEREQAWAMVVLTCAALFGVVLFWASAATSFSWARLSATPLLPAAKGWRAVADALPYALWWLIIIEGVALAAEQTHRPQRSLPRGLTFAILTVVVMVVLTTALACAALPYEELARKDGADLDYPLAEVVRRSAAGGSSLLVRGFSLIALAGLVASYHGLLYSTSRQVFALGRAGHLPACLGLRHVRWQVPRAALVACSVIVAGFVIANLWFEAAIKVAVLVAGLTSLVWYVLAMGCLLALRRREPALFGAFQAPLGPLLPVLVAVLSLLALVMCAISQDYVLPLTVALYAGGLAYYALWGRGAAVPVASSASPVEEGPVKPERLGLLDKTTMTLLLLVLGVVGWLAWCAWQARPGDDVSVLVVLALVVLALLSLSATALRSRR